MENPQNHHEFEPLFIKNEFDDKNGVNLIDKTLCGQIFRHLLSGKLSFFCTICSSELESIIEYVSHINDVHYKLDELALSSEITSPTSEVIIVYDEDGIKNESIHSGDIKYQNEIHLPIKLNDAVEDQLNETSPQDECTTNDDGDPIKVEQNINNLSEDLAVVCYFCNEEFKQKKLMRKHLKTCASRKDAIIPNNSTATTIDSDDNNKKYQCKYCNAKFKVKKRFLLHNAINGIDTKNVKYKCKKCEQPLQTLCEIHKHNKKYHPKIPYRRKELICDICKKIFSTIQGLRIHMKTHGAKSELFNCKICGKSFPLESYVEVHMRLHTGEKPYQCQLCGKCFTTTSRLAIHMRRHNGDLDRHKCEICGNAYRFPKMLMYHMRTHTGEKPHCCDICDKKFTAPKLLQSHKRLHTGEKPYKCNYCDMTFSQASNRGLHEKQKHNIIKRS